MTIPFEYQLNSHDNTILELEAIPYENFIDHESVCFCAQSLSLGTNPLLGDVVLSSDEAILIMPVCLFYRSEYSIDALRQWDCENTTPDEKPLLNLSRYLLEHQKTTILSLAGPSLSEYDTITDIV